MVEWPVSILQVVWQYTEIAPANEVCRGDAEFEGKAAVVTPSGSGKYCLVDRVGPGQGRSPPALLLRYRRAVHVYRIDLQDGLEYEPVYAC